MRENVNHFIRAKSANVVDMIEHILKRQKQEFTPMLTDSDADTGEGEEVNQTQYEAVEDVKPTEGLAQFIFYHYTI